MPKICQIDRDIESTDSSLEDGSSPKKKRDFQPVPRERLNNEKVNDFKNSKGEAMSEMEVSMSEMLGIETGKKKKRLSYLNSYVTE